MVHISGGKSEHAAHECRIIGHYERKNVSVLDLNRCLDQVKWP